MADRGTGAARPRRWIAVVVAAWSVAVVVAGLWGVGQGGATDREQTTVAQARPYVDRAAADLVRAAGGDGRAVVSISDFVPVGECRVTAVRSGVRYQRVVTALVAPGTEDALLRRVAQRLPASYGARVSDVAPATLTADAGLFVGVDGASGPPGVVRLVVDTGDCRVAGDLAIAPSPVSAREREPVDEVLGRLGVRAQSVHRYEVACPGGGTLSTVEALAGAGPSLRALVDLPGATRVATGDDAYGYRVGTTAVAVRTLGDGLDITATTPCP